MFEKPSKEMSPAEVGELLDRALNGEAIWVPSVEDTDGEGMVVDYWFGGQPQGFVEELGFDGIGCDVYIIEDGKYTLLTRGDSIPYVEAAQLLVNAVEAREQQG